MKDYSELTSRIYVQLNPEISQEFHNMLTEIAQELSRLYEIEKEYNELKEIEVEKMSKKPSTMFETGSPLEDFKMIVNLNWGLKFTTSIAEQRRKYNIEQALQRLEQYDDLMEKYNIKNIKELEEILERDRFNAIGKSIQYCKNEVVK